MRPTSLLIVVAVTLLVVGGCTDTQRDAATWPEIEPTHRPWTRWWWMGNAVRPDTLTRLLEKYADAGIGGVEITPIYGVKGEEELFLEYLSPQWMDMLDHTVREADRLGMGVDMANGTGWPFGGPTIGADQAARRAVTRTYRLTAGERVSEPLRYPDPEMEGQPAPLQAVMAYSEQGEVRNITRHVGPQGRLDWGAPSGTWTVYAVFAGWSGKQVERAAPGGEGYAIDHFSERALRGHLTRFDQVFSTHGNVDVRAFFNDSYELPRANWTPDFFEAFERQQGYDLRRHLPAFAGHAPDEKVARVRTDYRETLSDLLLDEFTRPWVQWTHERGGRARNQAHGSPAHLLDLYAAVDIAETETFNASEFGIPGLRPDSVLLNRSAFDDHPDPLLFKFASSGAHVSGDSLVSSETATWLNEHFRVSLAQIKPEIDQLFAAGINHVFFHGTPYSPPEAEWPGWLFYASTHFAPTNTFWRDLPGLTSYIARCQSFLQSGQPDNDVLLYVPIHDQWQRPDSVAFQLSVHNPEEWFYGTPLHRAAQSLHDWGYPFDYVSDRLLGTAQGSDEGVQVEGGTYDVVVIPNAHHMPVSTVERLIALAESGGTVIVQGEFPRDVPGWGEVNARRARLQKMRETVSFDSTSEAVLEASVGKGRILRGEDLHALLEEAGVVREPLADRGLSFVRRQHAEGHLYFVTNLSGQTVQGWIPLGTEMTSAVLFGAMHERKGVAAVRKREGRAAEVFLQLEPGESRILRTFSTHRVDGEKWTYRSEMSPHVLKGTWDVSFVDGGPVLPDSFSTESLASWTEIGGEAARRFAGTARYRLTFEAPSTDADAWTLDLGDVRGSAHVYLNGEDLGRVWAHPFERRVGSALQPGENRLEIEITNLMANRIADLDRRGIAWKKFYNINLVNINYEPFDASSWSPMASGLLGPVTLVQETELYPEKR